MARTPARPVQTRPTTVRYYWYDPSMQLGLARVLTLLASAWVVIEAQESSSTAAPTRPIDPVQLPYCSDWCTVHSTNSAGYATPKGLT